MSRLARPLPVEYLLVDVPASTPLTPQFTFYVSDNITPFPIENRYVKEINRIAYYIFLKYFTLTLYRYKF